jgi:hypothetical protein
MCGRKVRNILTQDWGGDQHHYQFLRKSNGKQINVILTLSNIEHNDRATRFVMLKAARAELRSRIGSNS